MAKSAAPQAHADRSRKAPFRRGAGPPDPRRQNRTSCRPQGPTRPRHLPNAAARPGLRRRAGALRHPASRRSPRSCRFQNCMPVPDGPPALVGLFGRGGRLVSVIDLGAALGHRATPPTSENQHFVLLRREQPQVALRVERALCGLRHHAAATERGRRLPNDAVTGYAEAGTGLADRDESPSLLDTERLLRPFLPSSPVPGV